MGVGLGLMKGGHSTFYILQLPINRPMAALLVVVVSSSSSRIAAALVEVVVVSS